MYIIICEPWMPARLIRPSVYTIVVAKVVVKHGGGSSCGGWRWTLLFLVYKGIIPELSCWSIFNYINQNYFISIFFYCYYFYLQL